jgi:eukaryotic-like serine/threonine-protein kinase
VERKGQWWSRPKRGELYTIPEWDQGGDTLDPIRPVTHVSWRDARAYVDWRNIRDGLNDAYDLPRELEWEKAARGVDGRFYPWGDRFDATLCKMRDSRKDRPMLERAGAFPTDLSVYGLLDTAGSVRDWCSEPYFNGDGELRVMRGGAWNVSSRQCRLASREGSRAWAVYSNTGFRLIRRATVDGKRRPEIARKS